MTREWRRKVFTSTNVEGFLFALPWIIGFVAFSLSPILLSGYYSFTNFSAIKNPEIVGFANYISLGKDPLFWKSLFNTLRYVACSIPLIIILSLFLASLLNMKIRFQKFFRSVFFLPAIIPAVASTMIWVWIFDPLHGYLTRILKFFGLPVINWLGDPKRTLSALIIIILWEIGTTIVIFLASLQEVPGDLYESAEIDGAGVFSKFFRITLPGISHIILYQVILGIINGFQLFTQVFVMINSQQGAIQAGIAGGPDDTLMMYPLYLYFNAFSLLKMGRAAAMAWILFLIVGLVTFILVKSTKRIVDLR
jgi:multiple sugar transport system permease protein